MSFLGSLITLVDSTARPPCVSEILPNSYFHRPKARTLQSDANHFISHMDTTDRERVRGLLKGHALEDVEIHRHEKGPVLVFYFRSKTEEVSFEVPPLDPETAIQVGKSLQEAAFDLLGGNPRTQ